MSVWRSGFVQRKTCCTENIQASRSILVQTQNSAASPEYLSLIIKGMNPSLNPIALVTRVFENQCLSDIYAGEAWRRNMLI